MPTSKLTDAVRTCGSSDDRRGWRVLDMAWQYTASGQRPLAATLRSLDRRHPPREIVMLVATRREPREAVATNGRHFAVNVDDVPRARMFYQTVFGRRFDSRGPPNFLLITTGNDKQPGIMGALQGRRELIPSHLLPRYGKQRHRRDAIRRKGRHWRERLRQRRCVTCTSHAHATRVMAVTRSMQRMIARNRMRTIGPMRPTMP